MAGAHVFPGGIVEEADLDPQWPALLSSSLATTAATPIEEHGLGVRPTGSDGASADKGGCLDAVELALRLAAIREVFEESGVLICSPPMSPTARDATTMLKWREASARDGREFLRMWTHEEVLRNHRPGTCGARAHTHTHNKGVAVAQA